MSESEKEIHENSDPDHCLRFFLSNARSLAPKITSLIDYMYDLHCDVSLITETWFKGGKKLVAELGDIEQASGIKILCKNRRASACTSGGGVAISFNTSPCNLKAKRINTTHEMLCATGKIGKIVRLVAFIVIYLPPKAKPEQLLRLHDELSDLIADLLSSLKDPVIIIGGDFNKKDISPAFDAVEDSGCPRAPPEVTPPSTTFSPMQMNSSYPM